MQPGHRGLTGEAVTGLSKLRCRSQFLWLLLVAMLATRALLPPGTMPEREHRGTIAITLCNSDGVWLIPMGDGAAKKDGDRQQRENAPCAFASLAGGILPPDPVLPAVPRTAATMRGQVVAATSVPVPPRPLPPARAPPQSV